MNKPTFDKKWRCIAELKEETLTIIHINNCNSYYQSLVGSHLVFLVLLIPEVIAELSIEVVTKTEHVTIAEPYEGMSAPAGHTTHLKEIR